MTSQQNEFQKDSNEDFAGPPKERRWRKIFDGVLWVMLVVAVGWLGWFGLKATRTVSRSLAGPDTVVRLQIVNATSDPTLGKAVAGLLTQFVDRELSFAVVDTQQFNVRKVPTSFVVARDGDKKTAEAVAARLGLPLEQITALPLEHNDRNVSVTLVLGDDYRTLSLAPRTGKETNRKT